LFLSADEAASARKEIEAGYDRAIRAMREAKAPEDLDAMTQRMDSPKWVSIVNDGTPQHWADVRGYLIAALGHLDNTTIRIVKFTLDGDRAVVIARAGASKDVNGNDRSRYSLVRDTWVKTSVGWRRKMHEKPAPGKLDEELK
jgi:hypothetical protein